MKKYSMETIVGIFVVLGLLGVGYMAVKLGNFALFTNRSYPLFARFTSVAGLRVGSPVEMFGIEIGQVKGLSMDQDEQLAVVQLSIRNGVKVFDDAFASIKTAGLIGDKYIQIDPGGAGDLLAAGGTILETNAPLDIGELIGKYAFGDVGKKE
jgi:phospholipid/cholesterol/gamma-HCH transport system substrate-binding protein